MAKPKDDEVKKLTPDQLKKLRGGGGIGNTCTATNTPAESRCAMTTSVCSNMSVSGGGSPKKTPGSSS